MNIYSILSKKYAVLFFIYEKKTCKYKDIKESLNISQDYIYRVCSILKNEGLIRKDYNENIHITEKGKEVVNNMLNELIMIRIYDNLNKKLKFILLLSIFLLPVAIFNLLVYMSFVLLIIIVYVMTHIIK